MTVEYIFHDQSPRKYAGMIHLSEQVELSVLEILQVIVKSYGQNTYLEEKMKSSQPQFYHFRLKFYAANTIFRVFR